jgi:hypothetical protein
VCECGPHTSNAANHLLMAAQETGSGLAGGGARPLVRETTPLVVPRGLKNPHSRHAPAAKINACVFFLI